MLNIERLRKLRKDKSIFQKQIAELLGITERQYRRYEVGEIDLSTDKLILIADFFEVSTDYLLGRTDNPKMNL